MRNTKSKLKPVTVAALIKRINRKFKINKVRVTRGRRRCRVSGAYHLADANTKAVVLTHVKPERWGREMGVLNPWEKVVRSG